ESHSISSLFHRAEQRMLMLAGVGGHLSDLGFGDLERKHAADALSLGMNFEHDARRRRPIHCKNALEYVDDELHRSVVVVQQYDLVQRRAFELRLRFLCNQLACMSCALFRHSSRCMIGSTSL